MPPNLREYEYQNKERDASQVAAIKQSVEQSVEYSEDYIGLLSNLAFRKLLDSVGDNSSFRDSLVSMRGNWANAQKSSFTEGEARDTSKVFGEGETRTEVRLASGGNTGGYLVASRFEPATREANERLHASLVSGSMQGATLRQGTRNQYVQSMGNGMQAVYTLFENPKRVQVSFFYMQGGQTKPWTGQEPPEGSGLFVNKDTRSVVDRVTGKPAPVNYDTAGWIRQFKDLQSRYGVRNLRAYNDMVKKAVALVGNVGGDGFITAPSAKDAGDSTRAYYCELIRYHYVDDGSVPGVTFSSYQQTLLDDAINDITSGNFSGMFTSDNSRFDNYEGVTLDDLNIGAEKMGQMANAYDRYLTECYIAMSNILAQGGISLKDSASGASYETLRSLVERAKGQTAASGQGASRFSPDDIRQLDYLLGEFKKYKAAMANISSVVDGSLDDLDYARFIVSYCGGQDQASLDEYWPWWEEDSVMTAEYYSALYVVQMREHTLKNIERKEELGFGPSPHPDIARSGDSDVQNDWNGGSVMGHVPGGQTGPNPGSSGGSPQGTAPTVGGRNRVTQ